VVPDAGMSPVGHRRGRRQRIAVHTRLTPDGGGWLHVRARFHGSAGTVPGSEGEYMWAGAGGTFFWIDPKEQLAVVYMAQTPGRIRPYYRRMIKALVAQERDN
jgi:CubicO group peptidase (beta-lactamase class C family)